MLIWKRGGPNKILFKNLTPTQDHWRISEVLRLGEITSGCYQSSLKVLIYSVTKTYTDVSFYDRGPGDIWIFISHLHTLVQFKWNNFVTNIANILACSVFPYTEFYFILMKQIGHQNNHQAWNVMLLGHNRNNYSSEFWETSLLLAPLYF